MRDVDNGGGYARVGAGDIWEIFTTSAQFCYEPKIALKNEVYFFKKWLISFHLQMLYNNIPESIKSKTGKIPCI